MAFKGDLRNLSLFDLFQTLSQNRQSGTLVLTRGGATRRLYFSPQGIRVYLHKSGRRMRLGEVFVHRGLLTREDVHELLDAQKRTGRRMGELIVETGKVEQEQVDQVLRNHAEDELLEIFRWDHGTFAFTEGEQDPNTPLSEVLGDPAGLCLEAARRLDEMEVIRRTIPDASAYFRWSEEAAEPGPGEFSELALHVHECFARLSSVFEARDRCGLSSFETLRATYQLLERGLLRRASVDEMVDEAHALRDEGDDERAARLFGRALDGAPDNMHIVQECIAAVQRLGDTERLASLLAHLGALRIGAGDIDAAVETLEEALGISEEHVGALEVLKDAYAAQGDQERAAEASLTLAKIFARRNELEEAIEACRAGLEAAPQAVALRYGLAQYLLRAARKEEAQSELRAVAGQIGNARGPREIETLQGVYRALLRIDSRDSEAERGLRTLSRKKLFGLRRSKIVMKAGIAGGVLLLAGAVAMVMGPPSAAALMEDVMEASAAADADGLKDAVSALLERHPDSPEALRASEMLRTYNKRIAGSRKADQDRIKKYRDQIDKEQSGLRRALKEAAPLEAAKLVPPYLGRLGHRDATSFRKRYFVNLELDLTAFIETIRRNLIADMQNVGRARVLVNTLPETDPLKKLREAEGQISAILRREWNKAVPRVIAAFEPIRSHTALKKFGTALDRFEKQVKPKAAGFGEVEVLYYQLRNARLRLEVDKAAKRARTEGNYLLRSCRFKEARQIFEKTHEIANSVTDLRPRDRYYELIRHIERIGVLESTQMGMDRVDDIVRTLREIDKFKEAGRVSQAFQLFRGLIQANVLVQFHKKWSLPFRVQSTPPGAQVFLDDKPVGKTPVTFDLPIAKDATLRLKRTGFADDERVLRPLADAELTGELTVELLKETAWTRAVDGSVEAPPIVAGELVLVASRNGRVYGLSTKDGSPVFELPTGSLDGIATSPLVRGNRAWVCDLDGVVHEIALPSGTPGRKLKLGGTVRTQPALVGKRLYVATTRPPRLKIVEDGKVVVDVPLARPPATPLLVTKDRVFVGTTEGEILVHRSKDGKALRRLRPKARTSFMAGLTMHPRGWLLAGAEDGWLYAFDPKKGDVVWRYSARAPVRARPLIRGNRIFVGGMDRAIHVLNLEGKRVDRFGMDGECRGDPAIVGDVLYCAAGLGRLHAFSTAHGTIRWTVMLRHETPTGVAVGGRLLVVATKNAEILAFQLDG